MNINEMLRLGIIWKIDEQNYGRKCPLCNIDIIQNGENARWNIQESVSKNRTCLKCRPKASSEMSKQGALKRRKVGKDHPFFGKHHTQESITRISMSRRGKCKGRKLSEETKMKIRLIQIKRFNQLNLSPRRDKGANEWFQKMNNSGFHFKQDFYFKELGYYADGYDEEKHIWIEYDTIYHKRLSQKEKDKIRQNRIVEYFKNIGKPIEFIRVDAKYV